MATTTGAFETVSESITHPAMRKGETVSVAISGTYDQVIVLQRASTSAQLSWIDIKVFNTEDQTEAFDYVVERDKEVLRLFLRTDDGGDATVSLTDSVQENQTFKDPKGVTQMIFNDDGVKFPNKVEFVDEVKSANNAAGTVAGTGVSVKEYSSGAFHKTVFTLDNAKVPQVSSGSANGVGSLKIYDFPTGAIFRMGCTADLSLAVASADQADFTDNTPQGDIGIGSLTMGNADAFGSDATDDDWGTGQAYSMTAWADSDVAINSEVAVMLVDGGTDADLWVSMLTDNADFDDSTTGDGIQVSGTITVLWAGCGQFA